MMDDYRYCERHQSKGPDVHSLVGIKAICLNGLVQHFRCHVALGANLWIVAHIQQVVSLEIPVCNGWFPLCAKDLCVQVHKAARYRCCHRQPL
ncbi:hypothetical protein INR49_014336 [Caranx melampygus]|nr:hypothetical protein INR49_014336 [Caranx melampygus]